MAKISLTSEKTETISAKAQRGCSELPGSVGACRDGCSSASSWAGCLCTQGAVPWGFWAGLAVPDQPGASHLHLHLPCWMWPQQIKENTKNKSQQFLDCSSALSAHQKFPYTPATGKSLPSIQLPEGISIAAVFLYRPILTSPWWISWEIRAVPPTTTLCQGLCNTKTSSVATW